MIHTSENFPPCTIAFKEWACAVESLGQGHQSVIIRKGGIHEKNGVFEPEYKTFFLFPTYEHQKSTELNEMGRYWLEDVRLKTGLSEPAPIPLSYLARIERVVWVDRQEWLAPLEACQVLNEQALEKRFHYGEKPGFFVLELRVYSLQSAVLMPRLPAYAGCRSWVVLDSPPPIQGIQPVLSDADFKKQGDVLTRLFGNHHG